MAPHLRAFLFGLTLAIAIGPIALLILRAGVSRGFATAARCGLGAAAADLVYAAVAFGAGAALLPQLHAHRAAFEAGAGLLLIALGSWLAADALRSVRRAPGSEALSPGSPGGFATTFVLTLLNPLTILLFAAFAAQLGLEGTADEVLGFALAVSAGSLLVQLALAAFGAALGRAVQDRRVLVALNAASGLGILAFGLRGLLPH